MISVPVAQITGVRRLDLGAAWGGIGAVELGLPVVWSQARLRGLGITDVVRWMCQNPAEWAGLSDRGAIAVGRRADMATVSPDDAFVVLPEHLNQRNKVTAYAQQCPGRRGDPHVHRWRDGLPPPHHPAVHRPRR